jgi:hypothetical protein
MGQTGVPTPDEIADKIVRLRDDQNLEWAVIAYRFGIKSETARKVYQRRKANPDPHYPEATNNSG